MDIQLRIILNKLLQKNKELGCKIAPGSHSISFSYTKSATKCAPSTSLIVWFSLMIVFTNGCFYYQMIVFTDGCVFTNGSVSPLQAVSANSATLFILKLVPKPLARFVISTGMINLITTYFKYATLSLQDVLDEVTDNRDLQAALAFNLGDYGKMQVYCTLSTF